MPNSLQYSHSPYLLQHKDNPVDWYSWSLETLEKAKKENKIIIVSIGYSTCHWCHVMAHECFENEAIAAFMNRHFISIKIDREERPDLDHYFMSAIQFMGFQGGWPLHCIMSPDQKILYGGTYFPPVAKYGRISWPDLLNAILESYTNKNEKILLQADKLHESLTDYLQGKKILQETESEIQIEEVLKSLQSLIDEEYGGMGTGQKFPNTSAMEFLQNCNTILKKGVYNNFLLLSVKRICLGGMYDHLQGGFFRYTVDRSWKIPHFEKMAYDHALIIGWLSTLYTNEKFKFVGYFIKNSFDFWKEEMLGKNGLYYAALDADSEGEEGLYYLWDESEIGNILKERKDTFYKNMDLEILHGSQKKVLNALPLSNLSSLEIEARLEKIQDSYFQLRTARKQRIRPSTDTKEILSWNALIAIALCKAYRAGIDVKYHDEAIQLITRMLSNYKIPNTSNEYFRISLENGECYQPAFLEDYVYLGNALWHVFQISGQQEYFEELVQLIHTIENLFSQKDGLFSFNHQMHNDHPVVSYDINDSSIPNANAVLCELYYMLYWQTNETEYYNRFQKMYFSFSSLCNKHYFSHMNWLKMHPDILNRRIFAKVKNKNSVENLVDNLFQQKLNYIYTSEMEENTIQLCTDQVCLVPCSSREEFNNQIQEIL
ncbi:MAG: thioredoxin domain-containing protein [Saprospiraceae bacterium]|nr:thioredoxin domain-containing protein [Saprospiraceae bacterium]